MSKFSIHAALPEAGALHIHDILCSDQRAAPWARLWGHTQALHITTTAKIRNFMPLAYCFQWLQRVLSCGAPGCGLVYTRVHNPETSTGAAAARMAFPDEVSAQQHLRTFCCTLTAHTLTVAGRCARFASVHQALTAVESSGDSRRNRTHTDALAYAYAYVGPMLTSGGKIYRSLFLSNHKASLRCAIVRVDSAQQVA